ncbi:MAG: hypothetical protein J0M04_01735 [Verrucomicrobia bacterium]|nr:hypothetical protein [Verrucomicrobiota bacterium]
MTNFEWRISNFEFRISNFEFRISNGEFRMANFEWRISNGEWRMANGEWRMANGEWRMANGEWRMGRSWSWWRRIRIRAGEAVAGEVDHGVGFTGDPDIGFRRERLRSLTLELAEFMACLLFPAVA